ncbi:hypothetical protein D3C76_169850 [compost metagenome]
MGGVPIGLSNLVYAKLIPDTDIKGGTASYETPVNIPGAISANVNPNASSETLFADDGPYETATTIGQIALELNVADLGLEAQADLLGHTIQGGILIRKSSDIPPWVAVGFKSLKSNGKYRYTWLGKGKFGLPEQANQTKGDSVNWNTPTISGSFVKRDSDDEWERHIDEDSVDYIPSLGANWFNNPFGSGSAGSPLAISNTTPANNATAVAVNTSIVWTFNNALAMSTVNTSNFMFTNASTGAVIPGALTINAARTIVTFKPTSNLTAATQYRATVTTNVKDLSGSSLSAAAITNFTTA